MADIELVIKIDEYVYKDLIQTGENTIHLGTLLDLRNIVKNGTPLPKGHGELIDKSKICKAIPAEEDNCTGMGMTLEEMDAYNEGIDAMYSRIKGTPTIIEADKESD